VTGRGGKPGRKPVTPRQPARPVQPQPPRRQENDQAGARDIYKPKDMVLVLWIAPEIRERNPDMPLSLHEALQVGRPFDPAFPIPLPKASPDPWWTFEPSWTPQAEREAGA
jgi:hypothetical protein